MTDQEVPAFKDATKVVAERSELIEDETAEGMAKTDDAPPEDLGMLAQFLETESTANTHERHRSIRRDFFPRGRCCEVNIVTTLDQALT